MVHKSPKSPPQRSNLIFKCLTFRTQSPLRRSCQPEGKLAICWCIRKLIQNVNDSKISNKEQINNQNWCHLDHFKCVYLLFIFLFWSISLNCPKLRNQIVMFTWTLDKLIRFYVWDHPAIPRSLPLLNTELLARVIKLPVFLFFFFCFFSNCQSRETSSQFKIPAGGDEHRANILKSRNHKSSRGPWNDWNKPVSFTFCLNHNCTVAHSHNYASILLLLQKKNPGYAQHKTRVLRLTFGHKFCW